MNWFVAPFQLHVMDSGMEAVCAQPSFLVFQLHAMDSSLLPESEVHRLLTVFQLHVMDSWMDGFRAHVIR